MILFLILLVIGLLIWCRGRSQRVVALTPRYIELLQEFRTNERLMTALFNYATGQGPAPQLLDAAASRRLPTIDGKVEAGIWHIYFSETIRLCHEFARSIQHYECSEASLGEAVSASRRAIQSLYDGLNAIKADAPSPA